MIDVLLQPLAFSFMQKALIIGLIIAMPTAFLSCFLIVKGWSLMGDAISHAILPGVVLAYLLNFPLVFGAFAAGMCCALTTGYVAENCRVKRDTIMGVVFSGMFALGLVLYTGIETDVHLDHILFGNMLGVDNTDLFTALTISICVSLFLMARWPDLLLGSFDPVQASAIGLNVVALHFGLLAALSMTIVATLKAAGLILAISLLIAPGAIAFLLTNQFKRMIPIAIAVTMCAMIGGIYLSFWIDSAPAPTVILLLTLVFLFAFFRKSQAKQITTG